MFKGNKTLQETKVKPLRLTSQGGRFTRAGRRKISISPQGNLPSIFASEPNKSDFIDVFTEACNRSKKATASSLYDTMIKYSKFQKPATVFYAQYHFKLNTELGLKDFMNFRCKYRERPNLCLSRFENHRRKGVIFEYPEAASKGFSVICANYEKIDRKVLVKIFKKFDTNKDDMVDLRELKSGLEGVLTIESIEELFEHFDENKDNLLSLEEFLALFGPANLSLNFNLKMGSLRK